MASSTPQEDHQAASFLPRREQSPNPLPFPAQGHVLLCLGQAGLPEVGVDVRIGAGKPSCQGLWNPAKPLGVRPRAVAMPGERALNFLCSKLVHIADNVQQKPTYICSCCGCGCGQLSAINQWDLPAVAPSGFLPTHAEDACTGCSRCARACPISAISMDAMRMQGQSKNALKPVVNTDRCIGCGVCAIACPKAAMSLERCGERRPVPSPQQPQGGARARH